MKQLLLLLFSLSLISCGTMESGVNKGQTNVYTTRDDMALGAQLDNQIHQEMKVSRDASLSSYIQQLANNIYSNYPEKFLPSIKARVIISDQVNAFATPGGYLYVNTGLIKTVDNEAELAGVISHEIGHAIARHGTEQMTKAYGVEAVATIVGAAVGGTAGGASAKAVRLFGTAGLLYHGRQAELEADRLGMQAMYNTNYDLHAMETMFNKLQALQQREPYKLEQWLSTHPPISVRIEQVKAVEAELPKQQSPIRNTAAFQAAKARV